MLLTQFDLDRLSVGINKLKIAVLIAATAVLSFGADAVWADLNVSGAFNGRGNWSIDGLGSNDGFVGVLDAIVPVGSTVETAFLYTSLIPEDQIPGGPFVPSIDFDGTIYSGGDWTALGVNNTLLQAFRADVTAQVAATIGNGSAAPFGFPINSKLNNTSVDGEVLAIIYSNPGESERTVAFLDGFTSTTGQQTTVNFTDPLPDPTAPGFEAMMSLGIGFSFQPGGQISQVDVNGRRLTSSAGGQDDGIGANGGLITVGGIGDSPANPADPFAPSIDVRTDDELYNLALGNGVDASPFISEGDTSFVLDTLNPSNDDNIFFLGLNVTARAGVDNIPPIGDDAMTSGNVGDVIMHTFTGTDPDMMPVDPPTWTFDGLTGPGVNNAPTFDPLTQEFTWDSTGSAPGTYMADARISDGQFSDIATLTIELVPEPSTGCYFLGALLFSGVFHRRLSRKRL